LRFPPATAFLGVFADFFPTAGVLAISLIGCYFVKIVERPSQCA